jgi:hypothetical protein
MTDMYKEVLELYKNEGVKSTNDYINNLEIEPSDYNEILEYMLDDNTPDELFELMITHRKFVHTSVVNEFPLKCDNEFKLDLIWGIDGLEPVIDGFRIMKPFMESKTNALIRLFKYNAEAIGGDYFYSLFQYFSLNYDSKMILLEFLLNNRKTNKIIFDNYLNFVDDFTKKECFYGNFTDTDFKSVLNLLIGYTTQDQFTFLLEYFIKELVCFYKEMEGYKNSRYPYYFDIIKLFEYIYNEYGDKYELKFNINYDEGYHSKIPFQATYNSAIYDALIDNGIKFISTLTSFFEVDIDGLVSHMQNKIGTVKEDIQEGSVTKDSINLMFQYAETLKLLRETTNKSKLKKKIKGLLEDLKVSYDVIEMEYPNKLI